MRYLVTARVKTGRFSALRDAIRSGLLGAGSVAGDEYLDDMARARELPDGRVRRCCMKTLRWGGLARISHDPPQDPHYRDEVEGPSHI